jgi:hypothetical protein
MPKFRIYRVSQGKRTFLGTACAPTVSEALEMAAQFFEEDPKNLVAVERSWLWNLLTMATQA